MTIDQILIAEFELRLYFKYLMIAMQLCSSQEADQPRILLVTCTLNTN